MTNNNNIDVKYVGDNIKIGVHKKTGETYIQPRDTDATLIWYRFEPCYYLDYEQYINDYYAWIRTDKATYPDLSYLTILDGDTLEHYIAQYQPIEVLVNNECIYNKDNDVEYVLEEYKNDMKKLAELNFYPFIEHVDLDVVDYNAFKLSFKTNIRHKR